MMFSFQLGFKGLQLILGNQAMESLRLMNYLFYSPSYFPSSFPSSDRVAMSKKNNYCRVSVTWFALQILLQHTQSQMQKLMHTWSIISNTTPLSNGSMHFSQSLITTTLCTMVTYSSFWGPLSLLSEFSGEQIWEKWPTEFLLQFFSRISEWLFLVQIIWS